MTNFSGDRKNFRALLWKTGHEYYFDFDKSIVINFGQQVRLLDRGI